MLYLLMTIKYVQLFLFCDIVVYAVHLVTEMNNICNTQHFISVSGCKNTAICCNAH